MRAELGQRPVPVHADPEVDLGDRFDAEVRGDVDQQGQLDGVAVGQGALLQDPPRGCGLARQRLTDHRQGGEQQVDDGPGHELGDTPSAVGVPVERALVEALDHGDGVIGQQWPEQPRHEVGPEVGDIPVYECEQVALGFTKGHPHGLALASARRVAGDDSCPGASGDLPGAVGRPVVDHDNLVHERDAAPGSGQLGDDGSHDGADGGRFIARRDAHRDGAPVLGCGQGVRIEGAVRVGGPLITVRRRLGHSTIIPHHTSVRGGPAGRMSGSWGTLTPGPSFGHNRGHHPEQLRDRALRRCGNQSADDQIGTVVVRSRCQCPSDEETAVDFVSGLRCRECGRTYPAEALHVCDFCFGPLEVTYDYERVAATMTRERIAAGPRTIWRYADLLPVADPNPVDLGAGFTPLVRADRLAAELGLGELWIKDDTANPTGSFKDRVVSVALTKARQLGFKIAACASTGNLANSVAAHAARAGMDSVVLIPHDLERAKVTMTSVYGGRVFAVQGSYDDVNRLCAELTSEQPEWAFVNVNVRTYYAEGSKTLAFEVAEQLGWQAPDHVVVPIGSGSQLTKVAKGFQELWQVGLLDEEPSVRVSGAQAEGCSPVATAFAEGTDAIRPVKPHTIAKSLAIGNPADGWYALDTIRKSGGSCASVTDEEVLDGIRLLARTEGIFAETAGGVTIATLAKLAAQGVIRRDERVVAMITGHGLKTVEALADVVGPTATIAPTLDSFAEALAADSEHASIQRSS